MTSSSPCRLVLLSRLICCFLLAIGLFRLFALVLHDPVLGYGNSYDMVRIQACHQLWPKDTSVDISQGTPAAPLRVYQHYDAGPDSADCMPSSELLFTSLAIAGSDAVNILRGGKWVSIKAVGAVKAIALAALAIIACLLFTRSGQTAFMLGNALFFALLLTDPGITLYLNTFYSEFSAVFFLYGLLLSLAWQGPSPTQRSLYWPALMLLGFAVSKPQHLPLSFILASVCALAMWRSQRWRVALFAIAIAAGLLLHSGSGNLTSRNEIMRLANAINATGLLLAHSQQLPQTLAAVDLPPHCSALAGYQWQGQQTLDTPPCPELRQQSHILLTLHILAAEPSIAIGALKQSLPLLKDWTLLIYGNVEGEQFASVGKFYWHIWLWLNPMPDLHFLLLLILPVPLLALTALLKMTGLLDVSTSRLQWTGLVVAAQWITILVALLGDGLFDFSKHAHLALPLAGASWIGLLITLSGILQRPRSH
jgi:hypothetical protein